MTAPLNEKIDSVLDQETNIESMIRNVGRMKAFINIQQNNARQLEQLQIDVRQQTQQIIDIKQAQQDQKILLQQILALLQQ